LTAAAHHSLNTKGSTKGAGLKLLNTHCRIAAENTTATTSHHGHPGTHELHTNKVAAAAATQSVMQAGTTNQSWPVMYIPAQPSCSLTSWHTCPCPRATAQRHQQPTNCTKQHCKSKSTIKTTPRVQFLHMPMTSYSAWNQGLTGTLIVKLPSPVGTPPTQEVPPRLACACQGVGAPHAPQLLHAMVIIVLLGPTCTPLSWIKSKRCWGLCRAGSSAPHPRNHPQHCLCNATS